MAVPNLGPQYDLAKRLSALEDRLARLEANPLGQAFSVTQSDGSVGLSIGINPQDPSGSTALIFYQGSTTARDPNTDQHGEFLYIGELAAGGKLVDSGLIAYRPDGTESAVIGNRGVQILDTKGHTVVSSDEDSGEGLARPWVPLPKPVSLDTSQWAGTTGSGIIAESFFNAQHPKVHWNATAVADTGVSGTVQVTISCGAQSVSGASHSVTAGTPTYIDEVLVLPQPFFGQEWTFAVNAAVSSGTGEVRCQTWELYGRQS